MRTKRPFLSYYEQLYEDAARTYKALYRFDTLQEAKRFMNLYDGCKLYKENDENYYVTVPAMPATS